MNMWIGGGENLKAGDDITAWSPNESGGVTFQVKRWDAATAKAVIDRVIELGYDELALDLDREFGVES